MHASIHTYAAKDTHGKYAVALSRADPILFALPLHASWVRTDRQCNCSSNHLIIQVVQQMWIAHPEPDPKEGP